jgi:hypothetical protein
MKKLLLLFFSVCMFSWTSEKGVYDAYKYEPSKTAQAILKVAKVINVYPKTYHTVLASAYVGFSSLVWYGVKQKNNLAIATGVTGVFAALLSSRLPGGGKVPEKIKRDDRSIVYDDEQEEEEEQKEKDDETQDSIAIGSFLMRRTKCLDDDLIIKACERQLRVTLIGALAARQVHDIKLKSMPLGLTALYKLTERFFKNRNIIVDKLETVVKQGCTINEFHTIVKSLNIEDVTILNCINKNEELIKKSYTSFLNELLDSVQKSDEENYNKNEASSILSRIHNKDQQFNSAFKHFKHYFTLLPAIKAIDNQNYFIEYQNSNAKFNINYICEDINCKSFGNTDHSNSCQLKNISKRGKIIHSDDGAVLYTVPGSKHKNAKNEDFVAQFDFSTHGKTENWQLRFLGDGHRESGKITTSCAGAFLFKHHLLGKLSYITRNEHIPDAINAAVASLRNSVQDKICANEAEASRLLSGGSNFCAVLIHKNQRKAYVISSGDSPALLFAFGKNCDYISFCNDRRKDDAYILFDSESGTSVHILGGTDNLVNFYVDAIVATNGVSKDELASFKKDYESGALSNGGYGDVKDCEMQDPAYLDRTFPRIMCVDYCKARGIGLFSDGFIDHFCSKKSILGPFANNYTASIARQEAYKYMKNSWKGVNFLNDEFDLNAAQYAVKKLAKTFLNSNNNNTNVMQDPYINYVKSEEDKFLRNDDRSFIWFSFQNDDQSDDEEDD